MSSHLSWRERLTQRWYAIPAVAQRWARKQAGQTAQLGAAGGSIPFARLRKPLAEARLALITTGGVHLVNQPPFDMENPDGDASYREIPNAARREQITITHKYYDHTDADRDLNVIFPLDHLRDRVQNRVVGAAAPRHFGFMGHIEGKPLAELTGRTAPAVAEALRKDRVDAVLLTPA